MDDLPLNALRAYTLVHAHGGVRAAARELGIAHSSVSRHLSELEAWLGVPLSEHVAGRGGWTPTAQGDALGKALSAALHDMQSAVDAVRELRLPFAVTVSTTPSFAARWLLPRLPALERAHPRIELSVLVNQKLDTLQESGVDLSVRMGSGPWPQLDCQALMDDALYPVMSPALWDSHGRPSQLRQLAGLRLLHDRDPNAGWDLWRKQFGPPSLNLQSGPRFASSDLLLRAAMQGQGVALARHQLVTEEIASGNLMRPFGLREVSVPDAYWIVRAPSAQPSRLAVTTVIGWLHQQSGH
ncbi:MAG: LysR substrate-binding domain-containing protein [Dokdonella sp.]